MSDTSIPDASPEQSGGADGDSGKTLCATLDSLKVGGVTPQEGDNVKFETEGKITRIDGDNAYIEPEKINGQDIPDDMKESDDQSPDDQEGMMRDMAAKADQEQGYA